MSSWYETYAADQSRTPDKTTVLVVHGWNDHVRNSILDFLNALGLRPIEWDQAVRSLGRRAFLPGAVLDYALESLQAIVVLVSPNEFESDEEDSDDSTDDASAITGGRRPNVLFEAGLALAKEPHRTILVEIVSHRSLEYISEDHLLRLDNSKQKRAAFVQKLDSAGCSCDTSGSHWKRAGDFSTDLPRDRRPTGRQAVSPSEGATTRLLAEQDGVSVKMQPALDNGGGKFTAWGRVTNSTESAKQVIVSVTYFAKDDSILGSARGMVEGVPPNGTKTIETTTRDDIGAHDTAEVQIDHVFMDRRS